MLPPGLSAFHLILWKFVILHFTLVQVENRPFKPDEVWNNAIRRLEVRFNALSFKVTRKAIARCGQALKISEPEAENKKLAPLAYLGNWGKITHHDAFKSHIDKSRYKPPVSSTPGGGRQAQT